MHVHTLRETFVHIERGQSIMLQILQVNIWSYTGRKLLHSIDTGHSANMFCSKFVPETSDELVVSGAGDAEVEVGNPNVVWSASEDGTLKQHDFQEGASCPPGGSYPMNVAIFCDAFARLYDRRMLPPLTSHRKRMNLPPCANYFFPMHLSEHVTILGSSSLHLTHVRFSPNGDEVLLSYSGEHVYLMNVNYSKLHRLSCNHYHLVYSNVVLLPKPIEMKQRYVGHCNVGTDIKRASFLGQRVCCILVCWKIRTSEHLRCLWNEVVVVFMMLIDRISVAPGQVDMLGFYKCNQSATSDSYSGNALCVRFEECCDPFLLEKLIRHSAIVRRSSLVLCVQQDTVIKCSLEQHCDYMAGVSDDGRWFIWEKRTGRLIKMLLGDEAGLVISSKQFVDVLNLKSNSTISCLRFMLSFTLVLFAEFLDAARAHNTAQFNKVSVLSIQFLDSLNLKSCFISGFYALLHFTLVLFTEFMDAALAHNTAQFNKVSCPFELLERFRMHEFTGGTLHLLSVLRANRACALLSLQLSTYAFIQESKLAAEVQVEPFFSSKNIRAKVSAT
ncbi:hypothetical protein POTOM_007927 [Populus tomentosa]|uniref:Transducin/WD40 repeat-like superfamily protein n=1 Tax=Populus tomentosa TaxID=118781 RepID=A0A8X8AGI3_POPTO|nr:hypothetical protein POTOM_007927 [Populus tomentosa]